MKQKWKINLHWDVAQEYKISSLERMSLLPCLENTFLLRCCDGAKQAWKSLGTLHAAAEEALAPEFSWEKVIQQARALKLEKVLKLGLNAIDEVYPHLIPQKIRAYALGNAQMVQVSERIRRWRFQRKRRFAQLWFACCVYLRVLESPLDKARFLSDSLHPLKLARQLFRRYMSVKTDLASFAPTPKEVVQKMLRLAEVTASDVVYDLGCGDGRMVVFAAKMCGARGVGVDIDPKRIQEAEVFAQREQVDHRVEFLRQDVKSIDCSAATVVMLYLPSGAYPLIKPVLEKLRPGTRIVTRTFFVDHLEPVKTETFKGLRGMSHTLYLYVA
ncbi:MAG: class I SAM-dependent methyltransferase [Deltaproteobacteria bacterium]|nr:class I SAM-dependent methyltransferase [Deltaproteobacteria bacterium]